MLRQQMKQMTRLWMIDLLGCMKHFWNAEINDIDCKVIDTKDMIFDPDGYVNVYGDFTGLLGERITITVGELKKTLSCS